MLQITVKIIRQYICTNKHFAFEDTVDTERVHRANINVYTYNQLLLG